MTQLAVRHLRANARAGRANALRALWLLDGMTPPEAARRLRYLGLVAGGASRARHRRRKASDRARRVTRSRR